MLDFRPIDDSDQFFLKALYASTRVDELAQIPWNETQKHEFIDQQFNAQHKYYQQQFPNARFDLVLSDSEPIGRLYVDRRDDEIRLIDIALLPEYRGDGIGTCLLEQVLVDAGREHKPVRIHVEPNNPAMRLYTRLGFIQIDSNGVYELMEWWPSNGL